MLAEPTKPAESHPKFTLLVVGRLHGLTRKRLSALTEQVGGKLAARPNAGVDLVAFAYDTARTAVSEAGPPALPGGVSSTAKIVSELTLKRMLRLAPPATGEDCTLERLDLIRASKLPLEILDCLTTFDVLDPFEARYAFRDLLVAREVKRLLDRGYGLDTVVSAAVALRRSRVSLCEGRLVEAPWGELLQETCAGLACLDDGQLVLSLPHVLPTADELFEHAEIAEALNNLADAERLYRRAMQIDRTDPVIPYNLGNVLDAQGWRFEAVRSYYEALQRDPCFAEAWFNLGVIDEEEGRTCGAISHYRAAVRAQANFSDAVFNLALLLTKQEDYTQAAPLWERFIGLSPPEPDRAQAERHATLCRIAQTSFGGPRNRTAETQSLGTHRGTQPLLC